MQSREDAGGSTACSGGHRASRGAKQCHYIPPARPPFSPATCWGRELALLPEMLPSSHLPAPSNPVEELEALKVSSETRKAEIWGSAGGCWGGV